MGIWVRSNAKNCLVAVDNLVVESLNEFSREIFKHNIVSRNNNCTIYLGAYSTKEKAIKVLDMIQEHILKQNNHFGEITFSPNFDGGICTQEVLVFQMPQDDEVV